MTATQTDSRYTREAISEMSDDSLTQHYTERQDQRERATRDEATYRETLTGPIDLGPEAERNVEANLLSALREIREQNEILHRLRIEAARRETERLLDDGGSTGLASEIHDWMSRCLEDDGLYLDADINGDLTLLLWQQAYTALETSSDRAFDNRAIAGRVILAYQALYTPLGDDEKGPA